MKVCVVGSGGREHALASVLGRTAEVVVTPGNPGIPGSIDTPPEEIDADLFVIGPEAPLVDGLADRLRAAGRLVFHDTTPALVSEAAGRTYVCGPVGPSGGPPPSAEVVSAVATADGPEYRIVTTNPPPGARPVEPSLEDGYAALLCADRAVYPNSTI